MDKPRDLILFRLTRLAAASGQPLVRYCERQFGISRREWRLILILTLRGPCGCSQLSEWARLAAGPTSQTVSQLTAQGLATRTRRSKDRRRVVIALTRRGKAIFDALYPKVQELDQLLLSGLSHEERGMLEHMFVKLEDRVESWMNDIELPKANHRRVALPTRANSLENAAGEQHQAERSACKP